MSVRNFLILGSAVFCLISCAGPSDQDRDLIPDELDECPKSSEDMDSYRDNDGCPDLDNDKDGVFDSKDVCPLVAEDRDGFQDEDGCPDLDNDGDGIPDLKDRCPSEKEDRDGFQDGDGCLDADNDQDGIVDSLDRCSMDSEDLDGFEDADGCPDLDNDKDGIKDSFDKCPNVPETMNGRDDEDGCPDSDAEALAEEIELPIRFEPGLALLSVDDKILLDTKIFPGLQAHPEHRVYVYVFLPIADVEIPIYLDLINQRTQVIASYLQEKGIPEGQVRTRTITAELYSAQLGSPMDFNANRPVLFKRKNVK
jgi:hypothetical protein